MRVLCVMLPLEYLGVWRFKILATHYKSAATFAART